MHRSISKCLASLVLSFIIALSNIPATEAFASMLTGDGPQTDAVVTNDEGDAYFETPGDYDSMESIYDNHFRGIMNSKISEAPHMKNPL